MTSNAGRLTPVQGAVLQLAGFLLPRAGPVTPALLRRYDPRLPGQQKAAQDLLVRLTGMDLGADYRLWHAKLTETANDEYLHPHGHERVCELLNLAEAQSD